MNHVDKNKKVLHHANVVEKSSEFKAMITGLLIMAPFERPLNSDCIHYIVHMYKPSNLQFTDHKHIFKFVLSGSKLKVIILIK
jgi:hypothetical protein